MRGQQRHQLAVDLRVAGHHLALEQEVRLAGEVADQATGLGDHQRAGGHVPGVQAGLEEAVVPAGGHVAQVQRGGAGAAQAGAVLHHRLEHLHVAVEVVATAEREAGADQRFGQPRAARDPQPPVVQVGAAAARGVEQVIARGVVDDRLLHLAAEGQRDRHAVHREAVQEVRGAIERVDDPHVVAVLGAVLATRFLGQDAVARVGGEDGLDDRGLGRAVDFADEVIRPLGADGQQVQVLRAPVDDRPGCARGLDGDVEHGVQRGRHGGSWQPAAWRAGWTTRGSGEKEQRAPRGCRVPEGLN